MTRRSTTRSRRAPSPSPTVATDAPRKLQLLGRGLGVAGSYAKVLLGTTSRRPTPSSGR